MYRDQLFCVLTPPLAREFDGIQRAVTASSAALKTVLADVGGVHYASLFVLPPRPADEGGTRELIVGFELTVDPVGKAHPIDDVLGRIVDAGLECLWPVFAPYSELPDDVAPARRRAWLNGFLVEHVRRADGGFVGARDVTVRHVVDEAALYARLRHEAALLEPLGLERDDIALRLSTPGTPLRHAPPTLLPGGALDAQAEAAADRRAAMPWAEHEAVASKWCKPSIGPVRRSLKIVTQSGYGVGWVVIVVALIFGLAVVGAFVAGAAQLFVPTASLAGNLALPPVAPTAVTPPTVASPEVTSPTVAPPTAVKWVGIALAFLWAAGIGLSCLGAYLWLRNLSSNLLIATALYGLAFSVAMTILLVATAVTDFPEHGTPAAELLPQQYVLRIVLTLWGWGIGWGLGAVGAALIVVVAVAGALRLTPPDRGTLAFCIVAIALTVTLVLASHAALWSYLVWKDALPHCLSWLLGVLSISPEVLKESSTVGARWKDNPHGLALLRLDGIFIVTLVAMGAVFWLLLLVNREAMRFSAWRKRLRMNDPGASVVPRAHQVHASIVASEASLYGRCNHMISLTEIRTPRLWWRSVTWLSLWGVGRLADTWWVRGMLGGASGIHFAHWYLIDEGRRLLFLSNYDGDFSGYLDEFIHGAAEGTNLIWRGTRLRTRSAAGGDHPAVTNERAFPTVRHMVLDGCAREQWFKAFVRDSMLPHLFRFEAYGQGLQNILAARKLRNALCCPRTPIADDAILRALER